MYRISKSDILTINYTKPRLLKWPAQPRSKPGLVMTSYAGMWSALLASGHGFVTCSLQFGKIKMAACLQFLYSVSSAYRCVLAKCYDLTKCYVTTVVLKQC